MMIDPSGDRFPPRPRLIFMGTPEFAIPPLKALIEGGYEIRAVVTQPDRPKGRGRRLKPPPVKDFALSQGLSVLQPTRASEDEFCALLRGMEPDLIVVVAYGQILRKNLLSVPKWGVINIHASLLPKYRGAAPIQWAILNDESKTGLTVMRMDEGLDTGPILLQKEVPIRKEETAGELHDRLSLMAGEVILDALSRMAENRIGETPQDDSSAIYAPKIERKDARIDWSEPATRISCLIRALDPSPGAHTLLGDKEVKLFAATVAEESGLDGIPGRIVRRTPEEIHVETGQGVVGIREIQYPGKRRLPVSDFLRGFPLSEGTILGKGQRDPS